MLSDNSVPLRLANCEDGVIRETYSRVNRLIVFRAISLEDSSQSMETAFSSPPRHSCDMDRVVGVRCENDMACIINGDNSRQNFSTKNNDALETVAENEENRRHDISPKDDVDLYNFNFHRSQSSSFKKQARISKSKLRLNGGKAESKSLIDRSRLFCVRKISLLFISGPSFRY